MRLRWFVIVSWVAIVILSAVPSVYAADVLHRLTHGDQYSLALGTVAAISDATVRFEVETVISGKRLPSVISVQISDPSWVAATDLVPGDYVVYSLNKEASSYTIAWGIFKVSSLDMGTLEIIEGTLPLPDQLAFQWYLNSEGTEKDFYFVGTDAYVRHSDGTSTRLYPPERAAPEAGPATSLEEVANDESRASLEPFTASMTSEVIEMSPAEESVAAKWVGVLVAVILLLTVSITWWILRVKRSAG